MELRYDSSEEDVQSCKMRNEAVQELFADCVLIPYTSGAREAHVVETTTFYEEFITNSWTRTFSLQLHVLWIAWNGVIFEVWNGGSYKVLKWNASLYFWLDKRAENGRHSLSVQSVCHNNLIIYGGLHVTNETTAFYTVDGASLCLLFCFCYLASVLSLFTVSEESRRICILYSI